MRLPRPGLVILTALEPGVLVALSASISCDVCENRRRQGFSSPIGLPSARCPKNRSRKSQSSSLQL